MRHNYCVKSLTILSLNLDNCVMKIHNKIYFKRALSFKTHSFNLRLMQFAIPSQTYIYCRRCTRSKLKITYFIKTWAKMSSPAIPVLSKLKLKSH